MFQQLVYFVAFLGCALLLVTAAMSLRLFATRASRRSGATLSDTPEVRKMLLILVVAVGVCALAALAGIILAVGRLA